MLIAIVYPLVDGGIQQILQIYRGLVGRNDDPKYDHNMKGVGASSPSAVSVSDEVQDKKE
jgi:hypothetical protein